MDGRGRRKVNVEETEGRMNSWQIVRNDEVYGKEGKNGRKGRGGEKIERRGRDARN